MDTTRLGSNVECDMQSRPQAKDKDNNDDNNDDNNIEDDINLPARAGDALFEVLGDLESPRVDAVALLAMMTIEYCR